MKKLGIAIAVLAAMILVFSYGRSSSSDTAIAIYATVIDSPSKKQWGLSILSARVTPIHCAIYDLSCFVNSPGLVSLFELSENGKVRLTIRPDGTVERVGGYAVDEDAKVFWNVLARTARQAHDDQEMLRKQQIRTLAATVGQDTR